MIEKIKNEWDEILEKIKTDNETSKVSFDNFLKPLKPLKLRNEDGKQVLDIYVPENNPTFKSIALKKFKYPIIIGIEDVTGISCDINLVNDNDLKEEAPVRDRLISNEQKPVSERIISDSNLNSKYTFEAFVVGKNNNIAHAASVAVAEAPGEIYNPLFIYGGAGLGKTHLIQAIAHFILKNDPSKKVLYIQSEMFTNELIEAIRKNTTEEFHLKYRDNDVFLMDDVQFVAGKGRTEEEFFHTFESLYSKNKQIILTSDRPPREFKTLPDRLRTRFEMGLTIDIQSPDYETRMAILRKKEEAAGYNVDNEVIKYIAENIKSNIRELEGALIKVVAMSRLDNNREVNIDYAKEVLKDTIYPDQKAVITPESVINVVCDHFSMNKEDLLGSKRNKEIVLPRQIAMYLIRNCTNTSLEATGKYLGGRDHTTIIHGIDKISTDLKYDQELFNTMDILKKKLNAD